MLKKPSAPLSLAARTTAPSAMEVESTRVRELADGKKLIDVTLRRPDAHAPPAAKQAAPLVMPQFDDESDESSSSDEEDTKSHRALVYSSPSRKSQQHHDLEDPEDNNNVEAQHSSAVANSAAAGVTGSAFSWDSAGVDDVQQLTNANVQLVSQAREFKRQIKALQIQLEALAPVPGLSPETVQDILLEREGSEHDLRDAKIVHQAKTLRHLKRTLQREKQVAVDAVKQCKVLEASKQTLERENEMLRLKAARIQARATAATAAAAMNTQAHSGSGSQDDSEHASQPPAVGTASAPGGGSEAQQQVRKKLDDLKTKHDKLQLDFKKLHRALVREVGDDVPLDEILEGSDALTGKRGRAQQIVMLKAKVKKLEAELAKASSGGAGTASDSTNSNTSTNVDQRAQQELAGQQTQKQRLVDKLTLERDDVLEKLAQLTKKYDAVKSRSQTLEKDKHESKSRFQLLVDKSKNDDALIDALQKQLDTWKSKVQEVKRVRTAESASSQKDDRTAELERLRSLVAEYKRQGSSSGSSSSGFSQPSSSASLFSVATGMPVPSEASQYRTMAAEKERLQEAVKTLQSQLEEKERQLRLAKQQQPPSMLPALPDDAAPAISRIPRKPGMPALGRAGSNGPSQSGGDSIHGAELEALRRTFRESLLAKEDEVAALANRLHDLETQQQSQQQSQRSADAEGNSDDLAQEVADLQEENQFLRQEFEKLKTRYEALVRNAKTPGNSSKTR